MKSKKREREKKSIMKVYFKKLQKFINEVFKNTSKSAKKQFKKIF